MNMVGLNIMDEVYIVIEDYGNESSTMVTVYGTESGGLEMYNQLIADEELLDYPDGEVAIQEWDGTEAYCINGFIPISIKLERKLIL